MSPESSSKSVKNKKNIGKVNNESPLTRVREKEDTVSQATAITGLSDDVSIDKIRELNENLKGDLDAVINQMEFQVSKI